MSLEVSMILTRPAGGRRWRLSAAVLAVPLIAALGASAAAADNHRPQAEQRGAAKPTVVLVHGAFADASGWTREIAILRKAGFPVIAPSDPLRGLSSDAAYIRSVLKTISGPIILAGHSYGGAVITNAARGLPDVKALVYVGAFVPKKGESLATIFPPDKYPGSLLGPQTLTVRPYPGKLPDGQPNADLYINQKDFRKVFAGDQSSRTAAIMAAEQRPLSEWAFVQPSGAPAWKSIPSWDLVTLDDNAIPPSGQLFAAKRAHAHITKVHSAHDVMVSHPQKVVAMIERAYRATR
jgi:pimeloyl-ACP methyl ester carboxylesterase